MSMILHLFFLPLMISTLTCQAKYQPSITFLNYLSALSGSYLSTEFIVGNQSHSTNSSLILQPVFTPIFNRTGTFYAEELLGGNPVRRSLLVSVERPGQNIFMTYPYNLTLSVANLTGTFDLNTLADLLPFDLDYTHVCDRVVVPRSGLEPVFDVISWPFCTGGVTNPPTFTAVVTCSNITVTMHDVTVVSSVPEEQKVRFILHKTESFPLVSSMLGSQENFQNPCM